MIAEHLFWSGSLGVYRVQLVVVATAVVHLRLLLRVTGVTELGRRLVPLGRR